MTQPHHFQEPHDNLPLTGRDEARSRSYTNHDKQASPVPVEQESAAAHEQAPVQPETVPVGEAALEISGLVKVFDDKVAVNGINLFVPRGSFFGLVGRNGAGKTTTLSMATGMLRPTEGTVRIAGVDVWSQPLDAKRKVGVLPDGVFLFDRLTGEQLITYAGRLHGLDEKTVASRTADLLRAMDLQDAAGRIVADYSAGMTKKVALAAAMIHAPSLLVLDEPFEAVDPVSASNIQDILKAFVARGGTVILSSHVMDLVQRLCDHVAIMNDGRLLAAGTTGEVRGGLSLEERFISLVGGRHEGGEGLSWLQSL